MNDNGLEIELGALLIAATIIYEARIKTGLPFLTRNEAISQAQKMSAAITLKRNRDDPTKG